MSSVESKYKKRAANYKRGKNREVNVKDILRQVLIVFLFLCVYILVLLNNHKCFRF